MLQKNRCDIIPAATHWVWYFKFLFSVSEILYKLENAKCDILKGSTKRKLFGIELFKLNIMIFCV